MGREGGGGCFLCFGEGDISIKRETEGKREQLAVDCMMSKELIHRC